MDAGRFEEAEVYFEMGMQHTTRLESILTADGCTPEQRHTAFERLTDLCLDRLKVSWQLQQEVWS